MAQHKSRVAAAAALLAVALVLMAPCAVMAQDADAAAAAAAASSADASFAYPTNDGSSMGTNASASASASPAPVVVPVVVPMVEVDIETVPAQLMRLSELSDAEPGTGVTRLIFTEKDLAGRNYVKGLMTDAGLVIREDAMGNIFGRWVGSQPELGAVGSGSHADAIPQSGLYDGCLGVIGPIEAISALRRAGFTPKRSIEVLMFTSEEPTRFGLSSVGARAMASKLDPAYLASLKDVLVENGTFWMAARNAGYGLETQDHEEMVRSCALPATYYDSFLELHIEQGPLLEREGLQLGLVTAIAAPAALKCSFTGDGGHAGAQLMPARNDALLAAAELALAVEGFALGTGAIDTVATVGVLKVGPGAINSVPRTAEMEIDIRDTDGARRDEVVAKVIAKGEEIAERRKVRWTHVMINADPPATCAPHIVDAAAAAAQRLGLTTKRMVSRAYHDSLFMAEVAPTAMLFIPCFKGYSHRPDEYSSPADIKNGVTALALALAQLSLA
eukprot:CAMPEP_0197579086 /NCGR_PEP_ID=MMETSP1326-20131121/3159_1 /TAXON_ID=1155430 /ORGANISM="Genus nov. species nov., Strain RCC2288" /LENGTH=502 /DNA_ID=CAMNT_0043142445 /DNA_START=232 /DNA_END=1740 /DNA_ORIENTATION=-